MFNLELGNLLFGHSRGEYELDRDELQQIMVDGLEACGCDEYGVLDDPSLFLWKNSSGGITTPVFETRPYWWGDEFTAEAVFPNFKFFKDGTEIRWYKYALRDAYSNHEIDASRLKEIMEACAAEAERLRMRTGCSS